MIVRRIRYAHLASPLTGEPVVIRGAIEHWPARAWTPATLATRLEGIDAPTYAVSNGAFALDAKTGFVVDPMPVDVYAAHIEAGAPTHYLRAPLETLPGLAADVETPAPIRGARDIRRNLWFSGAGTATHLHFDLPANLIAQLHGEKRFTLFAPRESRRLYRHPVFSSTPHLAHFDPASPDYTAHPRARRANAHTTTLHPGDLLYIPPRWWHHARSLTTSIGVNFWWTTLATYPLALASNAYKRLRRLNI